MSASKITAVEFEEEFGGLRTAVRVCMDSGEETTLFSFFPDEISFSVAELVGLTAVEARALYLQKDRAYLRS